MNGFIYLSTGDYAQMTENSIASLLAVDPAAQIVVVRSSLKGYATRELKTQLYRYSPFKVTCYVDSDTVFTKRVDLAALADQVPPGVPCFMATVDPYPTMKEALRTDWPPAHVSIREVGETMQTVKDEQPFFNGGFLCWRCSPMVELLWRRWNWEWKWHERSDQFALARAIASTNVKVHQLPTIYNNFVIGDAPLNPEAYVHHFISGDKVAMMKARGMWKLPG